MAESEQAAAQRLNRDAVDVLRKRAEEGPVAMLNLLRFKPDGGARRYAEYGAAVRPMVEARGGRILFAGDGGSALLGGESWDHVLLVEYPTRAAFMEMLASPEYAEIAHLRTEALLDSELHPLDPTSVG